MIKGTWPSLDRYLRTLVHAEGVGAGALAARLIVLGYFLRISLENK